ncbi:succinate dehydrogenase, hydrophobic membrane anchor protein [Marinicauda algicola]|uniref:Succinate dehydrogenase hydrophobic membrane anchor subunit n=1 Tax=Marinicauda algicola TaxID=2029849 RepID=A0A4S2H0Z4_9PROT|nr:succinate dehydrogenase, hydrophobic membrane anchor protein [Marinicauda algicola]TGY89104.1 succinate dehydrogenase, hydrophobic membrane anchor protein [Marinicauda algicola]
MPDFRTPRSKVIGLGAAHSGVGHFIGQRVSAIALFFLLPVFLVALALNSGSLAEAHAFVANPLGAILTLATLTAAIYHMRLGVQVVVEDYIHKPGTKLVLLVANTLLCAGLWIAVLYSVLRIAA